MKVNLRQAVNNLAKKNLKFLQPMYEAITNSLEAGANEIKINVHAEDVLSEEIVPKMTGFSITDNGVGFTEDNIKSFSELWTDYKIALGCKGSGRFTWLNVYKNILIESEVAVENRLIRIPFNINYNDEIETVALNVDNSKTVILFKDVTENYYRDKVDLRELADIDTITKNIEQNLLVKLFLLKQAGKNFLIKIIIGDEERRITEKDIPELEKKAFMIYSDITKENYEFVLYYRFIDDRKNSKHICYCAHERCVKEENTVENLSGDLPNKVSFEMLLCSSYLDTMVNDSRDDFSGLSHNKQASYTCPLLYNEIKEILQRQVHEILMEQFPQLQNINSVEEQKAIESAPHLAKFIKANTDIVKTEGSLITKANKAYNKQKEEVRNKFEQLLKVKNVSESILSNTVEEMNEIALTELGEYILYRDKIIRGLDVVIENTAKKEKYLHELFMPQRTIATANKENNDYTMTNLWLLDDKFMTFTNAYSDTTIQKIVESQFVSLNSDMMNNKRPDVAVFYNKDAGRDVLIVEFKGAHAALGEKEKALAETVRNCFVVKEKVKEINNIWGYIITLIDEEFEITLRANGYKPQFTNASDGKVYHFYNEGMHLYVIDINSIVADAFARNKTFLDILKKQ